MAPSINGTQHNNTQFYIFYECFIYYVLKILIYMPSVVMLRVIMLSVVILSVHMISVTFVHLYA
jgi:hypothetical protein